VSRPERAAEPGPALAATLRALRAAGLEEAEVYLKSGRSRRLANGPGGPFAGFAHERGWMVRASGARASFATAGSGEPSPGGPWPEPDGEPFRLPEAAAEPPSSTHWSAPEDLDAPLIGEAEGMRLLESLGASLAAELPGARLTSATLEDGAAEHALASSRGVEARWRGRLAALRVEAAAPAGRGRPPATAAVYLAEREARRFHPAALARRLADRLALAAAGAEASLDRGELLLAPAVGARLLAGLLPLLVGPDAAALAAELRDRRGRIGSAELTVIDDGRLPAGALAAPCDGEGMPTRAVTLIEDGEHRQPLLAWHQVPSAAAAAAGGAHASGCSRRASWRDLPAPGPTHLYVRPRRGVSAGSLLAGLARGYYLLDVVGAGRFDLAGDRFELPVCGFAVAGGRAVAPVSRALLCGGAGALLRGVQAVARDLAFLPLDGMIGAPSLLVGGLELRPAGSDGGERGGDEATTGG
jgi:PmbA protein